MQTYEVDKNEVLRYLGYKNQIISEELNLKIDSLIEEGKKIASPRFIYAIFDVTKSYNEIILENSILVFRGNDIFNHLKDAKQCAVLAVTLGADIEKAILKYEKTEMTNALILDSVASTLIESVTDYCEKEITLKAKEKGLFCNYRYSSGYGDFPLDTQKDIITALNCEKRIGLTVTESFLMIPRKSVTAVIGLFDSPQTNEKIGCESCNLYDSCEKRKAGENCGI